MPNAHYISGTHWDREWYRTFQEYRLLFVKLVDGLLDLMENNPDFKYFHFDGQTTVLPDYIEMRPENKGRLQKLVKDGRILVGPWFTMPDLFCPGAEALVRNLLTGKRIANEWGVEPMCVAYTCDMFGHPSQMPQIYKGFNLPYCVLGRGTNEFDTPAFFNWRAPDGTDVFTFKLQDKIGYGAFVGARRIFEAGDGDIEKARATLKEYIEHEINRTNGDVLCLIDAIDHMHPAADAPKYVKESEAAWPGLHVEHSTLPAFFKEAEASAHDVPVRQRELRDPARYRHGYLWLIPNCVSSRARMKQANDESQAFLELQAEPLLVIAYDKGLEPAPKMMLNIAWQTLLTNHAHDSICGCSIDQVHRDMMYRFDQVRQLAKQLRNQSFGDLTALCKDLAKEPNEFTVTVANTLPQPRKAPVIVTIDFPHDWPSKFHDAFRSQLYNAFLLEDVDGKPLEYQILDIQPEFGERSQYLALGWSENSQSGQRYTVAVDIDLPALGFNSFLVKPAPMLHRPVGSLRTAPNAAANEFLKVTVESNGTLTMLDKTTGNVYHDLLTFEDRSEIGDGWFHGQTMSDEIALSTGSPCQISVIHDGPQCVTFRIQTKMNLPKRYNWHTEHRSDAREDLLVVSLVTLRNHAKSVEVETTVHNTIEDHRFRVLCPSGAKNAKTWFAHHPFDFTERAIAVNPETRDWSEMELAEKPFLNIQAVGDGKQGLAFISAGGMHEGGVVDDELRTIQTTLFRSYRRTVNTPGEKDGLELADLTFRYNLRPYAGELPAADLAREMLTLHAPLTVRFSGKTKSGYPRLTGELSPKQSFMEMLDNKLVFSAFKPAEDGKGQILRLWNPTGETLTERIRLWKKPASVQPVKLDESADGDAATPAEDVITITAGPHKIVGVRIL